MNGFVGRTRTVWILFKLGVGNGFVWRIVIRQFGRQVRAEFYEAFEILDGSAVLALGLGLIAEEERPGGGVFAGHARKAVSKAIGSVLFDDLFGFELQFFMQRDERIVVGEREGPIERGGQIRNGSAALNDALACGNCGDRAQPPELIDGLRGMRFEIPVGGVDGLPDSTQVGVSCNRCRTLRWLAPRG